MGEIMEGLRYIIILSASDIKMHDFDESYKY